jgi:hypothetical protein
MALILPCAGCGTEYARADMLEAYIPERTYTMTGIAQPFQFTPMRLDWVGPCCAGLANEWQP